MAPRAARTSRAIDPRALVAAAAITSLAWFACDPGVGASDEEGTPAAAASGESAPASSGGSAPAGSGESAPGVSNAPVADVEPSPGAPDNPGQEENKEGEEGSDAERAEFPDLGTARGLVGTRWLGAAPSAHFASIALAENLATFRSQDGTSVTFAADYSALLPACHGIPICVAVVGASGQAEIWFFGTQGDLLVIAECVSPDPDGEELDWLQTRHELMQAHEAFTVFDRPEGYCWNIGAAPYVFDAPGWRAGASTTNAEVGGDTAAPGDGSDEAFRVGGTMAPR